ncbi:uncharacterized protein LOC124312397 [Daphnia pulicaria]|uniref:uncharacterized protein LOC124312397 n=1 Tax=Daphnia pulicaria TaxID=35523 RepID=UPI001EEA3D07|nr:uncharacterized protein LOC124312397 [Daphnia pulicaria]
MTRAIIKRLAKEPEMLAVFSRLIEEQLNRNFIEKVPAAELAKNCHYIPYHYVKRESATTPIRIVYNCSCKGWNGVSFNDCVEAGAPLHNDQTQILINFRSHAIGIVADVEKAFHHINLHKADRDFLRWFWLEDPTNPESPLAVYRFRVVPFGAKSSPFILNAVMMHHLKKSTSEIAADILQSVFVDNIITGCESPSAALNYFTEANRIMNEAHLPLQAWGFSDGAVEKSLAEGGSTDPSRLSKTLGLIWNREKDTLNVQPPHLSAADVATRRDVLKGNGAFYDPLGFYTPLGTSSKILLQDICLADIKIDDELSADHLKRWKEIVDSINVAVDQQLMSLPRSYFGSVDAVQELHLFCDASRHAYGAVAYLCYKEQTAFVMSKARITPIKDSQREGEREISIPEAELMAAYLGTLLATTIIAALKKNGIRMKIFLWSDSQIIHFWISKSEGHPRQFITNRVKKIREFTQQNAATWRYLPSEDNPADILSRGATLSEFKKSSLWRSGPNWLIDRKKWPIWSVSLFKTSRSVHLTVSSKKEDEEEIGNIIDPSIYSWEMLLRTTGQIYRLLSNLKRKDASRKSWNLQLLNALELQDAENVWIRFFQRKHLAEELKYLQGKKEAWRPSLVSQLDLFLDGSGIIRCKGRLQNAGISESAKHPVLIPKKTVLARLIITSVHQRIAHYGVDSTIAHLMQKYWIPSARAQVKALCRNCPKCRRESGPSYRYPYPASLPADSVQENYPFAITGVDYTGAIQVTSKGERISVYILLFTCGVTRAIHLEVVKDMTAGSFSNALKRFTGHHPIPRLIYSDNASTFVNASNYLLELFNHRKVQEELAAMRILWKFIPKAAPWYGGWWERLIALTKTALRKMVGRTILSFTQLQTVTTQIEAILNDRSLTKISTDENCIQPLTPSHLLYGQRLTTLPYHYDAEEELLDPSYGGPSQQPQVMTKAYLRSQNILRSFRRIWNSKYVPLLREHHQKTKGPMKSTIKVGDVVQIQSESKRANWKLAIIESINRGGDGQVRSAELKTATGRTSRPINKLYPVEVSENSSTTTQDANIQPRCIINESRSPSGRIPRQAARQASEKIKNIAYLESIIEE